MSRADLERLAGQVLLPGFVGPVCPAWLGAELAAGLAGVCLFGTNVESRDQLAALTAALRSFGGDPVIAVDEEGGDVSRLHVAGGSPAAGNAYLGRADDVALTGETMRAIGTELRGLGITMNLAPVADINSNPLNPVIGVRSFGAEPDLVSRHVAAAVHGLQSSGVGAVAKHFPGHGDTAVDSHIGLPVLDAGLPELTDRELRPFAAAIDAGVAAIMTGHLLVPSIDPIRPASLSPAVTALLRDQLSFAGLVVTDALDMKGASGGTGIPEAAVQALIAGAQLLCLGTDNTPNQLDAIRVAVADAVESGRLSRGMLDDAVEAVLAYRRRFDGRHDASPAAGYPAIDPARGLSIRRPVPAQRQPTVIRLHGSFNHAAGDVPWGVGQHLRPELDTLLPGSEFEDVHDVATLEKVLDQLAARGCVVVARNIGRDRFAAEAIARIRSRIPAAVVVEMGWPSSADGWDIASYGAGRAVSLAVAEVLGEGVTP